MKLGYINIDNEQLKLNLEDLYQNHSNCRTRARAFAILLNDKGYSIKELEELFNVTNRTVYNWLNRFEKYGIIGVIEENGRGRKPILKDKDKEKIIDLVEKYPIQLSKILSVLLDDGKILSSFSLKRYLKKIGYIYKRLKKATAKKPNPILYQEAKKKLAEFKESENRGELALYYFDESIFSLQSNLPYGWQKIGENIEIPSSKSKTIKVLGFLNPKKNDLHSYMTEDNVNSDLVIAIFDDFAKQIKNPTVVVVDNAPTHTSNKFKEAEKEWKKCNLTVYFLPPYSPKLNTIEILWRFIKYYWLEVSAYVSFETLWEYIEKIFSNFGNELEYEINFA